MYLDPLALGIAALTVGGIAALAMGLLSLRNRGNVLAARLVDLQADPFSVPRLEPEKPRTSWLGKLLGPFARIARPGSGEEAARLQTRLQQGGFRSEHAVTVYLAAKVVLAVAFLAAFLLYNSRRAERIEPAFLVAVVVFAAGFYLPEVWLSSRTRKRQTQIERGLPDALDLLVTCVEAGLGLDASLQRVADEVQLAWSELSSELRTTFLEVKAGIPRVQAFRRLASRTGVQDLQVALGDAHADRDLRHERRARAPDPGGGHPRPAHAARRGEGRLRRGEDDAPAHPLHPAEPHVDHHRPGDGEHREEPAAHARRQVMSRCTSLIVSAILALGLGGCARGPRPDVVGAQRSLANELIKKHDFARAFAVADALCRSSPREPDGYLLRGIVYREQRLLTEAEGDLKEAVRLAPKSARAHSALAILHDALANSEDALEHHRRAVKLEPNDPQYLNNLGFSLFAHGKPREAVETLQRAVRAAPADARIRNNLGFAFAATGDLHARRRAVRVRRDTRRTRRPTSAGRTSGAARSSRRSSCTWRRCGSIPPRRAPGRT